MWYCTFTDCGRCSREQQGWQVNDTDRSAIIILGSIPVYSPLARESNLWESCEVSRAKCSRFLQLPREQTKCTLQARSMTCVSFKHWDDMVDVLSAFRCLCSYRQLMMWSKIPSLPHSAQRELLAAHLSCGIRLTISTAWILIALTNLGHYEDVLAENERLARYEALRAYLNHITHTP